VELVEKRSAGAEALEELSDDDVERLFAERLGTR
jgi:hypothetical protein